MKRTLVSLLFLLLVQPAPANVLVKTGTIDKSTGAATASQPVTGIGFQPKLLIFYHGARTNFALNSGDSQTAIAWISGAGEEMSSLFSVTDNVSTTESNRNWQPTKLIGDISGIGTASALADLTSFDSDGFTLSWTTNTASATKLAYIAIGGSDIEANVTSQTMPTGSPGTQTFAHGLSGGAPDIVFMMSNLTTGTGIGAGSVTMSWTITSEQWAVPLKPVSVIRPILEILGDD